MTKVTCPCCKGERYLFVVNAEFPDEPPLRQPCCHCGTTGYLKLTVSEAATYQKSIGLWWVDIDHDRNRSQE